MTHMTKNKTSVRIGRVSIKVPAAAMGVGGHVAGQLKRELARALEQQRIEPEAAQHLKRIETSRSTPRNGSAVTRTIAEAIASSLPGRRGRR